MHHGAGERDAEGKHLSNVFNVTCFCVFQRPKTVSCRTMHDLLLVLCVT